MFNDWNWNGEEDLFDEFWEYEICMEDDTFDRSFSQPVRSKKKDPPVQESAESSNKAMIFLVVLLVIFVAAYGIKTLGYLFLYVIFIYAFFSAIKWLLNR